MSQPIQRNGAWWYQQPDGSWVSYNDATGQWEPQVNAPPPPPPPPPATAASALSDASAESSPYFELPKDKPRRSKAKRPSVNKSRKSFDAPRPLVLVAGVLVLAVVVAGVFFSGLLGGGDTAPAAPAGPARSDNAKRATFIAKADALCKAAMDRQRDMMLPETQEELVAYLEKGLRLSTKAFVGMKRLHPPRQDRREVKRLFGLYAQALRSLRATLAAARNDDAIGFQKRLARTEKIGQRFDGLALKYGMVECSKSE